MKSVTVIRTRIALLTMTMPTWDTCNVTSHLSSLYLYVTFAHFHCRFVINIDKPHHFLSGRRVVGNLCLCFWWELMFLYFEIIILLSTGQMLKPWAQLSMYVRAACPYCERMNKCQHWNVLTLLLPGHARVNKYPINSVPFLSYCSCLRVAYITGVGKYGSRHGRGPRKIQFLSLATCEYF
jgi:hypothetical protein